MNRRRLASVGITVVTSALAAFAHAQPTILIRGDATCPSAEMIRTALATARPNATWPQQTVTVEVAGDRIFLTLGDSPAVRRELPADRSCAIRAESVAVIIAAWSGELGAHPTDSPVLETSDPGQVMIPAPILEAPAPAPLSLPEPAATAARPAPAHRAAPKVTQVIEVDGGGFYSWPWGHAPGVWLSAGRTPLPGGLGVRVFAAYQSSRDLAMEGGNNQILRLLGGAAATYHVQRKRLFTSGDLGLVGTFTHASGSGYQPNGSGSAANIGALADLRGGLHFGRTRVWLGARVLRLLNDETVKVQSTSPGVADHSVLSAWDAQLGAGVGFRFE